MERKLSKSVFDHEFLVTEKDDRSKSRDTFPVDIVLDNFRSSFNVGSALEHLNVCVQNVHLCGYTSTPEDKKLKKQVWEQMTLLNWSWNESTEKVIKKELKKKSYKIWCS